MFGYFYDSCFVFDKIILKNQVRRYHYNVNICFQCLCKRMENSWLGFWKGIVLGQHCDPKQQEALHQATKELSAHLDQHAIKSMDEQLLEVCHYKKNIKTLIYRICMFCKTN